MLLDSTVLNNENLLFYLTHYISKDTKLVPMKLVFRAFCFLLFPFSKHSVSRYQKAQLEILKLLN